MHLVGFIIRIYHDARSSECQIFLNSYNKSQKDALFLNFIFGKEFHRFRTDLLSIISYVDCLLADSHHN